MEGGLSLRVNSGQYKISITNFIFLFKHFFLKNGAKGRKNRLIINSQKVQFLLKFC